MLKTMVLELMEATSSLYLHVANIVDNFGCKTCSCCFADYSYLDTKTALEKKVWRTY